MAQGYWADYIDPCSGLPMITTNCNKVSFWNLKKNAFPIFDVLLLIGKIFIYYCLLGVQWSRRGKSSCEFVSNEEWIMLKDLAWIDFFLRWIQHPLEEFDLNVLWIHDGHLHKWWFWFCFETFQLFMSITLLTLQVFLLTLQMECLLNYKSYNAGFCKILTHPKWGSAVYPATIFTYAPRNIVLQLLREHYPAAS